MKEELWKNPIDRHPMMHSTLDGEHYPPPPQSSVSMYELGFGTVAGICAGVFVKKGAKALAWALGGVFVLLQVSVDLDSGNVANVCPVSPVSVRRPRRLGQSREQV